MSGLKSKKKSALKKKCVGKRRTGPAACRLGIGITQAPQGVRESHWVPPPPSGTLGCPGCTRAAPTATTAAAPKNSQAHEKMNFTSEKKKYDVVDVWFEKEPKR